MMDYSEHNEGGINTEGGENLEKAMVPGFVPGGESAKNGPASGGEPAESGFVMCVGLRFASEQRRSTLL